MFCDELRYTASMASRSLFLNLRRSVINHCYNTNLSQRWLCSSGGALRSELAAEAVEEAEIAQDINDDLKSRIMRLRLPKRSAINAIQRWLNEGNSVSLAELRSISKDLRRFQRYKHALEISEWMVTHEKSEISDSDYAIRIDLMAKVFGIDAAERFFDGLPHTAKTRETYTALLHSFAAVKLVDKAEELFERMKESSQLSVNALPYNEIMTLYVSVRQLEKVSSIIEELKRQKVKPDIFTYNLWISSCAAVLDIDKVSQILDEMVHDPGYNDNWARYVKLANIYVTAGQLVGSGASHVVEADKTITQREWITYDFLIILHAGLGNKDQIDQIWKSLHMTKQKMTSRNYVCILCSYLMLGHLKEVGEVIDQWRQSASQEFNMSACERVVDAFTQFGSAKIANDFKMLLIETNCSVKDSE